MTHDMKIGIIGGDMRQLVLAKELAKSGYKVACYGTAKEDDPGDITICKTLNECVADSACIILGVPYSTDNKWINCPPGDHAVSLKALFDTMTPDQLLLGGRLNAPLHTLADRYGIKTIDYFELEELNIANAVPTAEGALELAMRELDITLNGSRTLVLGYGRIGKVMAQKLRALGSHVSVAARKDADLAWIKVGGYTPCNIYELEDIVSDTDVIFNTVPDTVLDRNLLSGIGKKTLIIDLASKPGGVDMEAAKELGRRVIWALSLPGKVAPVTAGRIIADCILNIFKQEGII